MPGTEGNTSHYPNAHLWGNSYSVFRTQARHISALPPHCSFYTLNRLLGLYTSSSCNLQAHFRDCLCLSAISMPSTSPSSKAAMLTPSGRWSAGVYPLELKQTIAWLWVCRNTVLSSCLLWERSPTSIPENLASLPVNPTPSHSPSLTQPEFGSHTSSSSLLYFYYL